MWGPPRRAGLGRRRAHLVDPGLIRQHVSESRQATHYLSCAHAPPPRFSMPDFVLGAGVDVGSSFSHVDDSNGCPTGGASRGGTRFIHSSSRRSAWPKKVAYFNELGQCASDNTLKALCLPSVGLTGRSKTLENGRMHMLRRAQLRMTRRGHNQR